MEPITHFLTGACLSRAGLNRKTPLATLTLVLATEAADLDFVFSFKSRVDGFAHHRGFTHTFLGAPLVAALVVAFVYGLYRWSHRGEPPAGCAACPPGGGPGAHPPPRWGLLYLYACLGALVHVLLDFTNAYGVRPFEPFSYKWYSWDIVSIVDPWILTVLILGLVGPWLFGLINEEIGARRPRYRGRGGAIFALVCLVAIWGLRDFEHRRALAAMDSVIYQGAEPLRVSAYPYASNPFLWHGVAETETFFETMHVNSLTGEVDPDGRAVVRYKPEETPASLAAKESYLGRVYLDWAQYPMTEVEPVTGANDVPLGYVVRLYDLRYTYLENASRPLGAYVELDNKLNVISQHFGWRTRQEEQEERNRP